MLKSHFKSSFRAYFSLILFAVALPFLAGIYPTVHFTQEQIDIQVYPDHVEVNGTYVYENPFLFPVTQGFTIPFPVDKNHLFPTIVSVEKLPPGERQIQPRFLLGKHRFDLFFLPREKMRVGVQYRQKTLTGDARYILTTTKPWRRPLERGIYNLFLNDVEITSSNYLLNSSGSDSFYFEREKFMPSSDWQFSWKVQ